jgi:hypothetical protein
MTHENDRSSSGSGGLYDGRTSHSAAGLDPGPRLLARRLGPSRSSALLRGCGGGTGRRRRRCPGPRAVGRAGPPRHELRRGRPGGFARVVGATLMAELSYGGVRTREEELQVPSAYG